MGYIAHPHCRQVIGNEGAGVIAKIGEGVNDLKIGDRVAYCQAPLGSYADYHTVSADKVVKLPDSISFEQAAAGLLKGLTVYYLLNLTYTPQPGEKILFHAAAGGVGLIACQWAKAIGVKLIGTVGSDEKGHIAKKAGAWQIIDYSKESITERLLALTHNEKVNVVYDSIGKDTWLASLDCLRRRGLMVSFGNASGAVTGVDLGILNQKGSLYVTRPSIFGYITTAEELKMATDALFNLMSSGAINVAVNENQIFALKDAKRAHETIQLRKTTGSSIIIP